MLYRNNYLCVNYNKKNIILYISSKGLWEFIYMEFPGFFLCFLESKKQFAIEDKCLLYIYKFVYYR